MARTITYGGAVSLDGFLTGPDDAIDWIVFTPDVNAIMVDYWKNVDAVLMGRKTYAFAQRSAKPAKKKTTKPAASTKAARPKPPKVLTYVFSRTIESIDAPGVQLVRDAVPFVRDLKARPGGNICLMGGGELAASLLGAGLVDEVSLNIHPILLGSGAPVFRDPGHRVALTLTESRTLAGGCVLASYRVRAKT